ncbi:ankyrin repeat domain-containing protein [Gammaproteobacteria bacterium]|nr:ankyrin repeat domain-containing protein [Gammaproteobacteria bacterium]
MPFSNKPSFFYSGLPQAGAFYLIPLLLSIIISSFSLPAFATPLSNAVQTNNVEAVLQLGDDPDGTTALMWAVHYNNLELIETLIETGVDINASNDYGSSAMLETMLVGNNRILALLLSKGTDPEWTNPEGETALMIAARSGNLEAAATLLEHGANINAREQWGEQSALMWASAQHQPEMVKLLIQHGAEVDAKSKTRLWNRRITSEPRPKDMNKGGFTPLLYAARQGCLECARHLVEAGANLNITDPDRVTALSLALINQHFDLAAYLIEAGADLNKWDLFGRAPLYLAVDMNTLPASGRGDIPVEDTLGGLDIVTMLLERGANPNAQLKMRPPYRQAVFDRRADHILGNGATPLMRAAKASDDEVIELLLEYGALVDLPNWMGITPLMVAAGLGRTENATRGASQTQQQSIQTLQLLLAAGADINVQASSYKGQWASLEDERPFFNDIPWDGQTALHGAAKLGWTEVVEFLVDQGAAMQIPDINNKTALDLAYGRYAPAFLMAPPEPLFDTIAKLEQLCQSSDNCQLPTDVINRSE